MTEANLPPVAASDAIDLNAPTVATNAPVSESLINKGDLKAIREAPTAVDSLVAVFAWLASNQTISADVAGIVTLGVIANRAKLEPALLANLNH